MNTIELIKKKRDGKSLSEEEIQFLISSYTKGKIPDYQFSAFLMSVFLNGMNRKETAALTRAMLYSGRIIDLSSIKGSKIDKHSTGGVGDKTSIILTPIVAAAGVKVPMISGRGLGHSGGTLDKLESIPGFRTDLNLSQFKNSLRKCGAVLIGQTDDIAPADKLIYALRDVTATVESLPLITGSIMSKKLAEGIDGLVLDVKTGSGAFMKNITAARELTKILIQTAKSFDKKVIAFITDMNQPLGNYIGNWLEIYESIKVLQGQRVDDLLKVTLNLSGAMIFLGNKAGSIKEGIEISEEMISSGKAYNKFLEIVRNQGGDISFIENPDLYPKSKYSAKITASTTAYLKAVDTYEIGMAAIELGAGRKKIDDQIDPKAGIIFYPKIGDKINKGEVIAEIYTDKKNVIKEIRGKITAAVKLSNKKTQLPALIKKIIE